MKASVQSDLSFWWGADFWNSLTNHVKNWCHHKDGYRVLILPVKGIKKNTVGGLEYLSSCQPCGYIFPIQLNNKNQSETISNRVKRKTTQKTSEAKMWFFENTDNP